MSRETISDAIRRHAGRGMSRRQLVMTYGKDAVIRVMGNEEGVQPASIANKAPDPFHLRLSFARARKGHGRPAAAVILGCSEDTLFMYEKGDGIPRRPELVASLAAYMGEDGPALAAEIAKLRAGLLRMVVT